MRAVAVASTLVLSLALTGCSMGPKTIKRNYTTYNQTIHYNQSQQMLLNLVRLKYRESPMFLKVGAVSTSYTFDVSGGASVGDSFGESNWGVNAGGGYSERPTVTYTPIEGDTFVKQMLGEVNLSSFVLLYRSGWPITALCHILVERIGPRVNNRDSPTYDDFVDFVRQLQEAQDRGDLEVVAQSDKIYLQLKDETLGMSVATEMIPLEDVQTRSFVDVMFYLAKNTQVPESQRDQVKPAASNGWMKIRSTSSAPNDAVVFVQYNGYFYSIARTDIRCHQHNDMAKVGLLAVVIGQATVIHHL
jgi:hypothetical protein